VLSVKGRLLGGGSWLWTMSMTGGRLAVFGDSSATSPATSGSSPNTKLDLSFDGQEIISTTLLLCVSLARSLLQDESPESESPDEESQADILTEHKFGFDLFEGNAQQECDVELEEDEEEEESVPEDARYRLGW